MMAIPPDPHPLLAPVAALVGWTLLVLLLIPFRRIAAARRGEVTPGDFRYGESARVSGVVSLPNRNYMNLLEAPVLFYACCLGLEVLGAASATAVALAWAYVGLRLLHSVVHLGYNNVLHRLAVFASSNVVLLLLWLQLVMAIAR